MISADKIRDLATSPKVYTIRHIKTNNEYSVVCKQKAKINGEWVDGICYYSKRNGMNFWRAETDFEGFEIVN